MKIVLFKNNAIYTFIFLLLLTIGILAYNYMLSNSGEEKWQFENGFRIDKEPIINRFPKLGNFEKCYWKADTIGNKNRFTVPAPTSYWIKGFVILNVKEIEVFKSNYQWTDCEENWMPTLDTKIISSQSLKWAYSKDFDDYIKTTDYIGGFYFNLERGVIFFDIVK